MMKDILLIFCLISAPIFRIFSQEHALSVQTGHSMTINDLSFSPDGRYLVSAGDDNILIIWDIISGKQVRIFEGHQAPVSQALFNATGDRMASVSGDQSVIIWDVRTGDILHRITIPAKSARAISFTGDNDLLFVAGDGIFSISTKTWEISNLPNIPPGQDYNCVSATNAIIAAGSRNGRIHIYDPGSQQIIKTCHLASNDINITGDGRYLAGAGLNGKLRRWDLQSKASGLLRLSIPADKWIDAYFSVSISPDQQLMAGGNRNQKIYIYDLANGKTRFILSGHSSKITALEFSSDNKILASAGKDRIINLWDMSTGQWIKSLKGFSGAITCVTATDYDNCIAAGDQEGYCQVIELWPDGDMYTTRLPVGRLNKLLGWRTGVDNILFNPDTRKAYITGSVFREVKKGGDFRLKTKPVSYIWDPSTNVLEQVNKNAPAAVHPRLGLMRLEEKKSYISCFRYEEPLSRKDTFLSLPGAIPFGAEVLFFTVNNRGTMAFFSCSLKGKFSWTVYDINNRSVLQQKESGNLIRNAILADEYLYLADSDNKGFQLSLAGFDTVNTCNASPLFDLETYYFATTRGQELLLSDPTDTHPLKVIQTSHSNEITSGCYLQARNMYLTGSSDGTLRFWDIDKGEEMYRLVPVRPEDKIMVTPDNYYTATKGALKGVGFTVGTDIYSFEQFDMIYNRPDKVYARTGLADSLLISNYRLAYLKRLEKMGIGESNLTFSTKVPEITIKYKEDVLYTRNNDIQFTVTSTPAGAELDRLYLLVNGVPEFGKEGMTLTGKDRFGFEKDLSVTLSAGINNIQAYVTDKTGVSSLWKNFEIRSLKKEQKPDLYLVAIGASKFVQSEYNLTYAHKDAEDIIALMKQSQAFANIYITKLLNEDVTLENIRNLSDFLGKPRVDDVVMIFIAGHGLLDSNLDYYFSTYDIDFLHPSVKGLAYDELDVLLGNTHSRKKVLLLDACHSGELDKEEYEVSDKTETDQGNLVFRSVGVSAQRKSGVSLQSSFEMSRMLFADMRKSDGSTVVSSAGGAEYAIESSKWNNGVFTYCFLDGLSNAKADMNRDKAIMLSELQKYIYREVPELTGGRQTPTSRVENLSNDFRIW